MHEHVREDERKKEKDRQTGPLRELKYGDASVI